MNSVRNMFSGSGKLLSSRNGTILVAGLAAVVAGALAITAVKHAQDNGTAAATTQGVLVATHFIQKGTPAEFVATDHAFRLEQIPDAQLRADALTDAAALKGKVALDDVYPGEQITAADFGPAGSDLNARLAGAQRAIGIPVDEAHGLVGDVHAGDRVDVLGGFQIIGRDGRNHPVLRPLAQDVLVLQAPKAGDSVKSGENAQIVLRVDSVTASRVAFAVDNGKVWVTLRPAAGAAPTRPSPVTVNNVLFGVEPIPSDNVK